MKKTIYIAGPMTGIKFFNFPAFDEAKEKLEKDWIVVSPADLDRQAGFDAMTLPENSVWDVSSLKFDILKAVYRDLNALIICDAIYLLPGWESSKGARAEKAVADWMKLEVLYADPLDVLDEAAKITRGDRQASYGPPDQDFKRTAAMWSAIKGVEFEAREVALFMIALKLSRETHQNKRDNWVDIAGYARCGSLCG